MLKSKKCNKKKYQYLMLENLDDSELFSQWKSRNLNDTRYIAKYMVNYLRDNLKFSDTDTLPDGFTIKNQSRVFAVKSKFVSNFRRQWLNPQTWGRRDKGELKKITYLDHAADAIVIANCRPEYVILSGEKMKLYSIYKNAGKKYTEEYNSSFNNCVESLNRYYGMDRDAVRKILRGPNSDITPIAPNLYNEVDNRLRDYNTHRVLFDANDDSDEQILELFKNKNRELYMDDPEFAESINMPVISYKPERKYTGEITASAAISIKKINGELMQVSRKSVNDLKPADIEKIYTNDSGLKNTLSNILSGKSEKYTVGEYLKENELNHFTTENGQRVNKVSLVSALPSRYYIKQISSNNYTAMNDRKYYCVELYKTKEGKNNMTGIAMSDLVKKNGKLWLKPDYSYPEDYDVHVMYLFKGDYIRIVDSKGKIKLEGYYLSVKNINENRIYSISNNKNNEKFVSISPKDKCIKLSVDVIGKISGENNGEGISCGEPLSLLKEKN